MDYEKAWNTLKAESGHRTTLNFGNEKDCTLKELMDKMEERMKKSYLQQLRDAEKGVDMQPIVKILRKKIKKLNTEQT